MTVDRVPDSSVGANGSVYVTYNGRDTAVWASFVSQVGSRSDEITDGCGSVRLGRGHRDVRTATSRKVRSERLPFELE